MVSCRFAKPHFAKPHFASVELSSLASLELWLRAHRPSTRPSVVSALTKRGLAKLDWRNAMQPYKATMEIMHDALRRTSARLLRELQTAPEIHVTSSGHVKVKVAVELCGTCEGDALLFPFDALRCSLELEASGPGVTLRAMPLRVAGEGSHPKSGWVVDRWEEVRLSFPCNNPMANNSSSVTFLCEDSMDKHSF